MMQIDFLKIYPSGNPTVLVDNSQGLIDRLFYHKIASLLMEEPFLGGEQVGFIERPLDERCAGRLQMMGGELCINALISYGQQLSSGSGAECLVESSGLDGSVKIRAQGSGTGTRVALSMPARDFSITREHGLMSVNLPGITHFVEVSTSHPKPTLLERRMEDLKTWTSIESDAIGVIHVHRQRGKAPRITPIIHVPQTSTTIWETACGSGSIAAALVLNANADFPEQWIEQPSGAVFSIGHADGWIEISTDVFQTASGRVDLSLFAAELTLEPEPLRASGIGA